MVPFLDLKRLNAPYKDVLNQAATDVVESGWYIRGHYGEQFERAFAEYCGVKHAVGIRSDWKTLAVRVLEEF